MKVAGKIWGKTQQIVANGSLELHRIEVLPDTQCSIHSHKYKWNGFYVEKGSILIRERMDYGNGNELWDETILDEGMYHEVKPGHDHQFVAIDSHISVVYEIYFANFQHDDIVRKTVGGVVNGGEPPATEGSLSESPFDRC